MLKQYNHLLYPFIQRECFGSFIYFGTLIAVQFPGGRMRILRHGLSSGAQGHANADVATYESVLSLPREKFASCSGLDTCYSHRSHRPPGN